MSTERTATETSSGFTPTQGVWIGVALLVAGALNMIVLATNAGPVVGTGIVLLGGLGIICGLSLTITSTVALAKAL
jgi:hypothetical protein